MATITKRGDRYQVRIRRNGYPEQSDTLRTKPRAERLAAKLEEKRPAHGGPNSHNTPAGTPPAA